MTLAAPMPADESRPIRHRGWVPRKIEGYGWRLVKQTGDGEQEISPMRFSSSKTAKQTAAVWNEEEGRGKGRDDDD